MQPCQLYHAAGAQTDCVLDHCIHNDERETSNQYVNKTNKNNDTAVAPKKQNETKKKTLNGQDPELDRRVCGMLGRETVKDPSHQKSMSHLVHTTVRL